MVSLTHSSRVTAPASSASDVTVQVNLSAGDAAYAALTVPQLFRAHPGVAHRLIVVDCCRAQRTRIHDPEKRQSQGEFERKVSVVRGLAEGFRTAGLVDEIAYLEPGDARFPGLAATYTRRWMTETHDYGACALMGYWAAFGLPKTRFVLHYDGDMLVHQDAGFSWVDDALALWEGEPRGVAAVPRMSPPGFAATPAEDAPTVHEGRPKEAVAGGWLNDWFSTRCLLIDRSRLAPLLPLVGPARALNFRLRRLIDRGYPPAPEILLHHSLGKRGFRCLNLGSQHAWLLHPNDKGPEYHRLLPSIMASVAAGRVPSAQKGYADLRLDAWAAFLDSPQPA